MAHDSHAPDPRDPIVMTAALRFMISRAGEPSFADLSKWLPYFTGDCWFGWPDDGVILWRDLSPVAAQAMSELFANEEIEFVPCHEAVYGQSGLPVPDDPRWLPVKIRPLRMPDIARAD